MSTGTLMRDTAVGTANKGKLAVGSSVLQAKRVSAKPNTKERTLLQVIKEERMRMVVGVWWN
jgi:hypothetical protein